MKEKIKELIEEAKKHTFQTNNYNSRNGTYSRPNIDMQAWMAESEDFLITNYGKDSAPWRIYERFERGNLDGNYENTFEREKNIIVSALNSCIRISSKKNIKEHISTKELDLTKVFIVHGHD